MTHLRIENQNSNTEIVSAAIILKLYEMALSAEGSVSLKGNLLAEHAKQTAYNYLTGNLPDSNTKRFPELSINVTDGLYINFADPEVERVLLANNIGDGVGITTAMAAAKSGEMPAMFRGNTTITNFDELALFGWNKLYCKSNTDPTEGAFYNCTNLVSIDLDNIGLISGNSTYKHAFANCTSLTTVKNIHFNTQNGMFQGCTSLQSIDLSESGWIGNASFNGCTSLTTVITRTDGNFIIGAGAFKGCNHLTTIDLSHCTSISGGNNEGAFQSCFLLNNIDTSNVTSFGLNAFLNCSSITSIDLSSCTSLEYAAFSGCTSLSNVTWPNQNFTMAGNAFKGTNLAGSLTINYLTSIGSNAFENTKVTDVDFSGSTFTNFPASVFSGVTTLTKVIFPTTLTSLGTNNQSFTIGPTGGNYTIDLYGLNNVVTLNGDVYICTNIGNAVCFALKEAGVSPIRKNASTITVKQLYFPKLKYSIDQISTYLTYLSPYSMFNYRGWEAELSNSASRTYMYIKLLYFKDLETIYSVMFYSARPKNLVINNVTPPLFVQSTYNANGFSSNNSFIYNSNFTEWDTKPFGVIPYDLNDSNCMTIYVPDSAVATYQANSLYNMYTIRGINEINPDTNQPYLTRYATNALWEAAGRPDDALIEEYM